MRTPSMISAWLSNAMQTLSGQTPAQQPPAFLSAQDVTAPPPNASLLDDVDFLLRAKRYIAQHPIPEDRTDTLNQYSHARKPLIGDDRTRPALTNCSYEHFGRKLISIGWPLFIEQAPLVNPATNNYNAAFHGGTMWGSFIRLVSHYAGPVDHGGEKYGYSLPTHHYYVEKPVPEDVFNRAQSVIDFYTRTDITDPQEFINTLATLMNKQSASLNPSGGPPVSPA